MERMSERMVKGGMLCVRKQKCVHFHSNELSNRKNKIESSRRPTGMGVSIFSRLFREMRTVQLSRLA